MILWLFAFISHAEEGLWPSDRVVTSASDEWKSFVPILSDRRSKLLQSVVALPNCSGTLASPNGLVVSNAHCIRPYLENNKERFLAQTETEELPLPDFSVYVTKRVSDVHEEIRKGMKDNTPQDYVLYRTARNTRVVLKRCREESKHNRCTVHWDPIQKRYQLTVEYLYHDVRLVHIPSHLYTQLDIAFIRVYENNEPISTPQYLTIHTKESAKNTEIAVLGYPQKSERYVHPQEWEFLINTEYPYIHAHTQRILHALTPFLLNRSEQSKAHKLYAMIKTIEKNTETFLEMLSTQAPKERLLQRQEEFLNWCKKTASRKKYCSSYEIYESILHAKQSLSSTVIDQRWISLVSDLIFSARRRFGWRYNRSLLDEERWEGYKDQDKESMILHLQHLPILLDTELEKTLLQVFFAYTNLEPIQEIRKKYPTIEALIMALEKEIPPLLLIKESILTLDPKTPEQENIWLSLGAQIEQQTYDTQSLLYTYDDALKKEYKIWLEGYSLFLGHDFYPNAAGDLRISFGHIYETSKIHLSFQPNVPSFQNILSLDLLPFPYFTSNVDVTKGNSGSPTIDTKGNWIGIVFGGNASTHTSSWFYAQNTETHHISLQHLAWYLGLQDDFQKLRQELTLEE